MNEDERPDLEQLTAKRKAAYHDMYDATLAYARARAQETAERVRLAYENRQELLAKYMAAREQLESAAHQLGVTLETAKERRAHTKEAKRRSAFEDSTPETD